MSLWAMSLSGAVMIIAIVILRALLINQLPKKTFLILWGIVMVRLVIPFTAPSAFSIYSLIPEKEQSMNTQFSGIQDNLRLSVFKGNLREMEAQQRADEQAREQNRDKKHENTI